MKIIFLKNSILLVSVKPTADIAKVRFFYFISWFVIKKDKRSFELCKSLSVSNIKEVYKKIADDWDRKYRI